MYEKNRAWIELNREHLLHNIKELQHLAGEQCELMPAAHRNLLPSQMPAAHTDPPPACGISPAGHRDFQAAAASLFILL